MPLLESTEFYKRLESRALASLYLFYGEEPFLLKQAFEHLKMACLQEGSEDFNYNQYFAGDCDVTNVRDSVELLPMMTSHRLVVLREAQELTDKEWQQLEPLFETPVETTVFAIFASKVDKRKKAFKLLTDHAQVIEFKRPYDNQLPQWIHYIADLEGLKISDEACALIHKLVGSNLTDISNEMKKIALYTLQRKNVEADDILACVSQAREESVFDFTRAVGECDRIKAFEQLVRLLDQGQNEVGIVSLVARHFRTLILLKQGQESGLYGARLATYAQVPSYFLDRYLLQVKQWKLSQLETSLDVLAETDKALKSSPLSGHIWLENMVLKTIQLSTGHSKVNPLSR